MSVTYVRNENGVFEKVGPGGATTDTTLSQAGKPADAAAVGAALTNYATQAYVSDKVSTKVDKVSGKSLSTNDFTTNYKTNLDKLIARSHNAYESLTEIGITTFPTTMANVATKMPTSSVIIIDSRRINGVETDLSTETISNWGSTDNGVALIMKGSSEHRISMLIVHSITDATGAYINYGNYAYSTNKVNWESTRDKVNKSTLSNIFGTYYNLNTTITPGENYSSASGSAALVGNMLRVQFSATRKSAANGNISNETVASFSIAHGGKITGGFAVSIGNGTSGHLANMVVSSVACTETALTFKVTLTATGGETTDVNPYFAIPVTIDIDKF
jgi:hypothetical protein